MQPTEVEMQEFKEDWRLPCQEGSIDVEVKIEATNDYKTNAKIWCDWIT
jgi:hypothetical protein